MTGTSVSLLGVSGVVTVTLCGSGEMSFRGYWYSNVVSTCLSGGSRVSTISPSPALAFVLVNGFLGVDIVQAWYLMSMARPEA